MDTAKSKIWVIGVIVAIFATLLVIIKFQHDAINKQNTLEQSIVEMKQLQDGVVRSQAQYVSKDDLDKLAQQQGLSLDQIRSDLKTIGNNANIIGVQQFTSTSSGSKQNSIASTSITPNTSNTTTTIDQFGYLKNAQNLTIVEPFPNTDSVPFGFTTFQAWDQKPWSLTILPRKYVINNVLAEDENGRHLIYNKFSIEVDGKTYPVKIEQAQFSEQFPEASFHWTPRLALGVDIGATFQAPIKPELNPNIEVHFLNHGASNLTPDWSLLGIGVGYETQAKTMDVIISPVSYNIGAKLPLMHNLFIGPSLSVDLNGKFGAYIGVHSLL